MHKKMFNSGEEVVESGLYRVYHDKHRLPVEIVIFRGDKFPLCAKCSEAVQFELLHGSPELHWDSTGVLPVLDEELKPNSRSLEDKTFVTGNSTSHYEPESNVDGYRELSQHFAEAVAKYASQAARFVAAGDEKVADEYRRLAQHASANAERFASLAHLENRTADKRNNGHSD